MKKNLLFVFFFFCFCVVFGNELKIGQALEPPHLDPSIGAAGATDEIVYNNVFEGLVSLDSNGKIIPLLAKKWTISKDKKTYLFQLEKGVFFHDGSKMTARDVVFSLKRIIAIGSVNAQKNLFKPIAKITAIGDSKVEIKLKSTYQKLLYFLSWGDAVIFRSKNFENNKNHPIGTGPFLFKKWVRGNKIELVKNKKYWGIKSSIKKVTFLFIVDPLAAYYALLTGEIDGFPNFPAPERIAQLAENKKFNVVIGNTEGEVLVAMNNKKGALASLKVRRAIQHAVNKEEIIQGAMHGYAEAIGSHFSPNHQDYLDLSSYYEYNLVKAKTLLKEAGYEKGFTATLKLPPTFYAKRSGEILLYQLEKIGIKLKIINLEWSTWLQDVFRAKNYDFSIIAHTEPYDFAIYARKNYYFNYDNPVFDKKIDILMSSFDASKRQDLHHQLMKILAEDAVNIFLFQLPKLGVWKKEISGFWTNSPLQANVVRNIQY